MVPKVIHYCWFGGNTLPDEYKKYIESWKKFCPDYEIKEWNESNFDVNENRYCREAYIAKKWAFVSDYARLKVIYENGGIYLDTDVELVKSLHPLMEDDKGFLGFQNTEQIATGLGFAAPRHNYCVKKMLDIYDKIQFVNDDGKLNLTPCPVYNTVALKSCGLKTGSKHSGNIQSLDGIKVYPCEYFNPLNFDTIKLKRTKNTYAIHHYAASWYNKKNIKLKKIKKYIPSLLLEVRTKIICRKDVNRVEKLIGIGK